MTTITLNITGDEQPASVALQTLTRSDTDGSVAGVTLPGEFTNAGSGVWTYTFAEPAAGLHYDYSFRMTWSDGSFNDAAGALDEGGGNHYATQTTLEQWQGADNLRLYSDVANLDTLDAARLESALTRADNEINRALRQRGYTAPLASSSADYGIIQHVADRLTMYYLMSPRDAREGEDVQDGTGAIIKANTWRRRAIDELNQLLLNGVDGARFTDAPVYPVVV